MLGGGPYRIFEINSLHQFSPFWPHFADFLKGFHSESLKFRKGPGASSWDIHSVMYVTVDVQVVTGQNNDKAGLISSLSSGNRDGNLVRISPV